jgi:Protein of unknown function DUF262
MAKEEEIKIVDDTVGEEEAYVEYDITSYPSDYTIDVLHQMKDRGDIVIPEYQRKYVWKIEQASLLVESFLLGLPVPPLFLYVRDDNKAEVIDGQQRLLSMMYFLEGYFGEPDAKGRRKEFSLTGLSDKSPFNGKTIKSLDEKYQRKIRSSVLRAINIRQLSPSKENTSVFHIFERLNTGGTSLKPQEIRNAVFRGDVVKRLTDLNKNSDWKTILGLKREDRYQKDMELVLRLFALFKTWREYEKPMKEFLNTTMSKNRDFNSVNAIEFVRLWPVVLTKVRQSLGNRPFRPNRVINAAVLEAVIVSLLENQAISDQELSTRYATLLQREDFKKSIRGGTTDTKVVHDRLTIAGAHLAGA